MNRDKQIEEMAEEILQEYTNCYSEADQECLEKMLRKLASDVAEEIFAEIEKEIELALDSNYRAKKEHYNHSVIQNYDNFNAMCDGKIYAMRGLLDFIAELKRNTRRK